MPRGLLLSLSDTVALLHWSADGSRLFLMDEASGSVSVWGPDLLKLS